jgi:hypothetical protein
MSISKEFIVSLKGRDYPVFAGVLDAATKAGLKSLRTEIVQLPTDANGMFAVVKAVAEFEDGRVFEDIADCSPKSTSPNLAASVLRLASTRAKGRVLRDACNVGQTLLEELPDLDNVDDGERPPVRHTPVAQKQGPAPQPRTQPMICSVAECGVTLSAAQATVSERNFNRRLCPHHQAQERTKAA